MAYKKVVKKFTEYLGESFSQSIKKEGGLLWGSHEVATYTVYDGNGTTGVTGSLVKSTDNTSLGFQIPKTATAGFTAGKYKVMVDLENTQDAEISDVIAEYSIEYKNRTA